MVLQLFCAVPSRPHEINVGVGHVQDLAGHGRRPAEVAREKGRQKSAENKNMRDNGKNN
jgi:hypothetical protein